ncbi:MAG TPA: nuclear transport factor 2 family protein [Acidimicrobiales bacterium]|nr:nuclear transport factor 2 family protein [Acidimicrobiales bacterium]
MFQGAEPSPSATSDGDDNDLRGAAEVVDGALQRLIDQEAVTRLVLTWMDGIDTRSYDAVRSAWADEQEVEFVGFPAGSPLSSGRYETDRRTHGLIAMISQFSSTQHLNTNHLVTVEGDRATCSCYVLATHHMDIERGEPWSTIGARYDLEAARLEGAWKLTKLRWTRLWSSGNDGLWAEAARRMAAGRRDATGAGSA